MRRHTPTRPARSIPCASLGVLACLVALSAGSARAAEDEIESSRSGPYIAASAGAAIPNFEADYFFTPPPFGARLRERPSLELIGRVGWRVLPHLAIEGQYEWVEEWRLDTKSTTCAKVDAQIVTGNVRLFAPFDAVQPYVVGGAGAGRYESQVVEKRFDVNPDTGASNRCTVTNNVALEEDEWELAIRFGAGFDVYITRHVIFNLEVSSIYSENEQLGEKFPFVSVSGGLGYRF